MEISLLVFSGVLRQKYKLNNNVLYRKTDIFLSDNLVVWYFPKDIRL